MIDFNGSASVLVPFLFSESSGIVTTTALLDYETQTQYSLIVTVSDNGTPRLEFMFFMVITVIDENDNSPQFLRQSNMATIPENSIENSLVINLAAVDADSGTNSEIFYSIITSDKDSAFRIDNTSGMVLVQRPELLDYETRQMFVLQVQAEDMGVPSTSSSTLVS